MGHTKPIAAHCFCAVAFQGGVAASAFIRRRFSTGVSASAFLHLPACIGYFCINSQLLPDAAALSSMQGTPASSISGTAPRQQHLPDGAPPRRPGQQETSSAPPASNNPHPAEKRTPVWLAIWRTWAGFANSQMRRAAFRCTYSYICVPIPVTAVLSRCSDITNLSAHLHRLPTPPPYLRQMRLPPGRGWSSSKSPSTDAKVNCLVIRYLYF